MAQEGYFTTAQAAESDFSLQLLEHHCNSGKLQRVRRGVYRLTHYPANDHEDLVILWLWCERKGVFSHGTALALYELCDYLPMIYYLTLPLAWKKRRLRVPSGVELFYRDLESSEWRMHGPVPITSAYRTLQDCADTGIAYEWLDGARLEAERRGLMKRDRVSR